MCRWGCWCQSLRSSWSLSRVAGVLSCALPSVITFPFELRAGGAVLRQLILTICDECGVQSRGAR